MSELKLCSYCKSVPQANTWTLHGISETRYFCPNPECPHSVRTVTLEEWQTRPIEDELNARIAELEAERDQAVQMVERLIEAGGKVNSESMATLQNHNSRVSWYALVTEWRKLVDEWRKR